jgi:RHS repeat-associated protein
LPEKSKPFTTIRITLSNRAETNAAGTAIRTFGHFPYGETWYETGTADKWKFTNYENDAESGLNYAGARFQSSGLGGFTSVDPLGGHVHIPQTLNHYPYAGNDPVNLIDPTGRSYCTVVGGVFTCLHGAGECFCSDPAEPSPFPADTVYSPYSPPGTNIMRGGLNDTGSSGSSGSIDLDFVFAARPQSSPLGYIAGHNDFGGSGTDDSFAPGSLAYEVFGPPSHAT